MHYIQSFFQNPRLMLQSLLLTLPGLLFALSAHEYSHARAAYKCGDNTAYSLGRMTLNPLKHIDPLGFILLIVAGFGWAKPVPVNPRNFKGDYRKCDLLVSLAGIIMNLILFVLGTIVMYTVAGFALKAVSDSTLADYAIYTSGGQTYALIEGYYMRIADLLRYLPYMGDYLLQPLYGNIAYYLFQMLVAFTRINLVLAVFNLLPVPPLDGYHVLNNFVLKRNLFASQRAVQIGTLVMVALLLSGVIGDGLSYVIDAAFSGAGALFGGLFSAIGLF